MVGASAQGLSWGWSHLKVWLGLENLLPRWLTYMALGWRPQFLTMWASPQDSLQHGIWLFPQSKWPERGREREGKSISKMGTAVSWRLIGSDIPSCLPARRPNLYSRRGLTTQGELEDRWHSWTLASTVSFSRFNQILRKSLFHKLTKVCTVGD